jgi:hypothetical protein
MTFYAGVETNYERIQFSQMLRGGRVEIRQLWFGWDMRIGRQQIGRRRLGCIRGCKQNIVFKRANSSARLFFFSPANGFDFHSL